MDFSSVRVNDPSLNIKNEFVFTEDESDSSDDDQVFRIDFLGNVKLDRYNSEDEIAECDLESEIEAEIEGESHFNHIASCTELWKAKAIVDMMVKICECSMLMSTCHRLCTEDKSCIESVRSAEAVLLEAETIEQNAYANLNSVLRFIKLSSDARKVRRAQAASKSRLSEARRRFPKDSSSFSFRTASSLGSASRCDLFISNFVNE